MLRMPSVGPTRICRIPRSIRKLSSFPERGTEAWYDAHAEARRYFYVVDNKGQLFLEQTEPKNIATSLKSAKFLDFFFRRVRRHGDIPAALPDLADYPWVSPCGPEMNYVRADPVPVVFHSVEADGTLVWGHGLRQAFDPTALRFDASSGKLFHPAARSKAVRFGLVGAQLAAQLSAALEDATGVTGEAERGKPIAALRWDGRLHPVYPLEEAEAAQ